MTERLNWIEHCLYYNCVFVSFFNLWVNGGKKLNHTHLYVSSASTWLDMGLMLINIFVSLCCGVSRNLKIFVICPNCMKRHKKASLLFFLTKEIDLLSFHWRWKWNDFFFNTLTFWMLFLFLFICSFVFGYILTNWGFPGGSVGKESAWGIGDLGSISGLGRSPGKGNGVPHSRILAWEIPWAEGYSPWRRKSQTQLSD